MFLQQSHQTYFDKIKYEDTSSLNLKEWLTRKPWHLLLMLLNTHTKFVTDKTHKVKRIQYFPSNY